MMNRVFINPIAPKTEGNEALHVNCSMRCADMAHDETETGFVVRKVFETLGLEVTLDPLHNSLFLEGGLQIMAASAPKLQRSIGLIARYGSEKIEPAWWAGAKKSSRDWWGRRLSGYVRTLSGLPEDAQFEAVTGRMLWDFADYCGDPNEVTLEIHGQKPWWPVTDAERSHYDKIFPPFSPRAIDESEAELNKFRDSAS